MQITYRVTCGSWERFVRARLFVFRLAAALAGVRLVNEDKQFAKRAG